METTKNKDGHHDMTEGFLEAGKELLAVSAGFLAPRFAIQKLLKKDTLMVNGAAFLGSTFGYVKAVQHHKDKGHKGPNVMAGIALGAMVYTFVRSISIVVADATSTPDKAATTSGLAGMIPESIKAKIREFIPSLEGDEEKLIGMGNTENDLVGIGELNDMSGTEDIGYAYEEVSPGMNGVGETESSMLLM